MTLTASLLLDLVILLLLVSFTSHGLRRGLVLTLCSLLATVVGLVGGWYLALSSAVEIIALIPASLSPTAADLAAKAQLFLAGFLGAQMVWSLVCRVLRLAAKLPVLNLLNKLLGGLLGLCKGILVLLVARWILCSLLGWIPPEVAAESFFLTLADDLPTLLPTLLGK